MKVAITGASGYVGSRISDGFRAQGHEILALSRRPCPAPWFPYALGDDPSNLPWEGVDLLVHAAYDFTPRTWQEILTRNVMPSVALLQAAKQAGVGHSIFISSMSSFEGCRSNYGKAKWMIETESRELGTVIIRPGLVWGNPSGGVMGTLEKLVATLPAVPFLTGGGNLKQWLIHETDLAAAVVAIAEAPQPGDPLLHSLVYPTPVSMLSILKAIAKRSNRLRLFVPVPWQLVMAGLKFVEMFGIRPPFRSDSLVGLVHGNPRPENATPPARIHYRAFQ